MYVSVQISVDFEQRIIYINIKINIKYTFNKCSKELEFIYQNYLLHKFIKISINLS